MGVPLINAIYESNPLVGLYTLPLLIWHPMQLVIGSAIAPRIAKYVERKEQALSAGKDENEPITQNPDQTTNIEETMNTNAAIVDANNL